MSFKSRPDAKTSITVVQSLCPRIGISSEALAKMSIYVDECADEIGWLGTAYKDEKENTIFIEDVYLFDQDVHGATTEITPEGLSDFAEELLTQGNAGIEIWNNLKMWGHSHVNMGVTPSGQDNSQMETFKEGGHDWFIRLIANKKGEMKLDLYDYKTGVVYLDMPWVEISSEQEQQLQQEIDALYELLDSIETERIESYKSSIKEEMKVKVRKMGSRVTTIKTGSLSDRSGYFYNGKWVSVEEVEANEKKTGSTTSTKTTSTIGAIDRKGFYELENVFEKDDDVREHFTNWELIDLSEARTFDEIKDELEVYGYYNYFTDNDVERIFRVAHKVSSVYTSQYGNRS